MSTYAGGADTWLFQDKIKRDRERKRMGLDQKECPDCMGEGTFNVSECCGAEPVGMGDSDTAELEICSDCKEHCIYGVKCERCNGTGIIEEDGNMYGIDPKSWSGGFADNH